ncbi:MAG: DUF2231 domain-containing protein [Gemmatimonadales bacterium]|nr:DUF2231 domain-containing protein [Gemmatimonadales bacterium]
MFANLLPDPLHPAVVHLPMALAVLLPLFALGSLIAIRRGAAPRAAWGVTVAIAALLVASGLVARETGEDGEELAEEVVPEAAIEEHEEAAERFIVIGGMVLALSLVGLRRDRIGAGARIATTVGTLAVFAAGWSVGEAGGELVYRHGAAEAYTQPGRSGGVGEERD